ncbi:signal peptide peptidase SppA [Vagococcus fessus]|uniref:Signal peptide peptidase SppA n=1 Tax=Vagococcus fessus TaxID=120370 RepID=A0A430A826_9ENTE|nr:signal peptide peptidase SppA [Vagococcus fessus]RSU03229.1 signal peptide peptidase SppA [Vagococcus fessus]
MTKKRWVAMGIALALLVVSVFPFGSNDDTVKNVLAEDGVAEVVVKERSLDRKIARLKVEGEIGPSEDSGLFGSEGYNHEVFMAALKKIEEDDSVKGILLEVNSPGGGVYESAEISRALTHLQKERKLPVYVSMKNMAASGGYYISAKADKIFATEETMTGSIGVIMSGLNMSGLLDKLGVKDESVKSGELKDIGSSTRKWTEKDRDVLQGMVDTSYNRFVNLISEGRGMSVEDVKKIADGRIYDGTQALENGLVDEIGFPDQALEALRQDKKLKDASVVEYEASSNLLPSYLNKNWLGASVKKFFVNQKVDMGSLVKNSSAAEAPRLMYQYGGE